MAVSKRLRFEILRRDNNTCRYCGRKAPEVEITIDHVLPQALGGDDSAGNLVACCWECNNGKTSIAPGSPLVEQVNEDAIRWSAAMQAAIAKAEEDHEAVTVYREKFLEAWNDYKRPAELDENWRVSLETFRTRGLPIEMLIDAAHRAMAKSNIGLGTKFRYMCGIAWAKISEIEKHARSIFATEEDGEGHETPTLKEEILPIIGQRAFEAALDTVGDWYDDDDRTGDQVEQDAIVSALDTIIFDRWALGRTIENLLRALVPVSEMWNAWEQAEADGQAEDHGKWRTTAERLIDNRADKHMESLTPEQREEWLRYAAAVHGSGWGSRNLTDEALARRAGIVAIQMQAGARFNGMCFFAGKHIDHCPNVGTIRIGAAGCTECGIEPSVPEVGLLICDYHLERAIDVGIPDMAGHRVAVTDFIVLTPEPEDEVPF